MMHNVAPALVEKWAKKTFRKSFFYLGEGGVGDGPLKEAVELSTVVHMVTMLLVLRCLLPPFPPPPPRSKSLLEEEDRSGEDWR